MIVRPAAIGLSAKRPGITLTEILISIMIMGIGMVSLATLFPLGLLKLRDASRLSRSAYLAESAAADLATRGLMSKQSFVAADSINYYVSPTDATITWTLPYWYVSSTYTTPNSYAPFVNDPFVQDTPSYGADPFLIDTSTTPHTISAYYGATGSRGQGLPVAYDPLWRWQTGIYLDPINKTTAESRFASGIGFVRVDPDGSTASAHGLQRLTNFNGLTATVNMNAVAVMPASQYVPSIFVSPEDVVWQDPNYKSLYPMAWNETDPVTSLATVDSTPSPLVPDLSISTTYNSSTSSYVNTFLQTADWRYSWMFTGRQVSEGSSGGATFDGDIVIFENRPFSLDQVVSPIDGNTYPQAAGERVVEAVFGYTANVLQVGTDGNNNPVGYGFGANKTVMLRWPATSPDPEVKVGSWIADVTYERTIALSSSDYVTYPGTRFGYNPTINSLFSPSTSGQRCHWYQVVKASPPAAATGTLDFGSADGTYRYMIVNVGSTLRAYTQLKTDGSGPAHVNAALVSPNVVQVIPRTFTVN